MVLRSRTMGSTSTRYMMTATTRNTQTLKAARPIKASRCRERLSSLRCMARTHSSSSTRRPPVSSTSTAEAATRPAWLSSGSRA